MDFLIFSDAHGRTAGMTAAFRRQRRTPDAVLFLGDGVRDFSPADFPGSACFAVRGNCDLLVPSEVAEDEMILRFEGHTLFLTHGHLYHAKYGTDRLIAHARAVGADIVLFGHTHRPTLERVPTEEGGEIILFNPGSIGRDRDGEGYSFGTLTLTPETVLFSHGRVD